MYAPVSSPTNTEPARSEGAMHDAPPPVSPTARRVTWILVALSIVGLLGAIGARMVREKQAAAERARVVAQQTALASAPPEVAVVGPVPFAYDPHFSITGTLDPVQQADLSFNVPGRLIQVAVALGEHVEAGQVLAVLDRKSVAAQSLAAGAAVQAADAQLALAQDRLRRAEALHARGASSDAELTASLQGVSLAQAQLAQAQAQTRMSSAEGSNHILRAPFAGTITRVPSGIGNVVGPGQELFRLEDLSSLVLRSGITERALDRVRVGDAVELENPPVRGVVRAFARSLDPVTRRAPIEITIPNPDFRLVGHSLVKGSILTNRPFPAMRVPGTAVSGDQTVLVVNAEGRIEVRQVMAVVETDGSGVVLQGIGPQDRVVVRPSPELTQGLRVRPTAPRDGDGAAEGGAAAAGAAEGGAAEGHSTAGAR